MMISTNTGHVWLQPGDVFIREQVENEQWEVSYAWDDGSLWGMNVTHGGTELPKPAVYWDHSLGGLVTRGDDVLLPSQITKAISATFRDARVQPPNPRQKTLLKHLAAHLDDDRSISGKRLRSLLPGIDRKLVDQSLRAMTPRLITIGGSVHDDRYSLRLPGILASPRSGLFSKFVEELLAWFGGRFRQDPDFATFCWDDIEGSVAVTNPKLATSFLWLAGLQGGGSHGDHGFTSSTPLDIEELQALGTFDAYLRHIRRGLRSTFSPTAPYVATDRLPPATEPIERTEPPPARRETAAEPELNGPRPTPTPPGPDYQTGLREYYIVGSLGQGGSGIVEEVRDDDGRRFALKLISPGRVTKDKSKRFRNELGFASKADHPGIVTVEDHGLCERDGKQLPFYVMPLYAGTLRKRIAAGIDPELVVHYALQLAGALQYAHGLGVWHRDLKPENVAVADDGRLVLLDFGIAHFAEDLLVTAVKTKARDRMANFQYAAPEQRTPKQKVDHRADIYALGLLLNEMFTGQVPHGTGFKTIKECSPEHGHLDVLVDCMIRQDAAERPPSLDEVIAELTAAGIQIGGGGGGGPGASDEAVRPGGPPFSAGPLHSPMSGPEQAGAVVTFVWHVTPGSSSSRTYEARRSIQVQHLQTDKGSIYKLGSGRPFVVSTTVNTADGIELHSELIELGDPGVFPEIEWRKQLESEGWDVTSGYGGPPEPS